MDYHSKVLIFRGAIKLYYIGIDLGTSGVKMILTDKNGKIHRTVLKEYPLAFPYTGWAEQNP